MFNLEVILNYNFDLSAKKSRQVLAIVERKNEKGVREKALTTINWKALSCFAKLRLWWNKSLDKNKIAHFVNSHAKSWCDQAANQDHQLKFEKQFLKLKNKIILIANCVQWKLNVKIQYPSPDLPGQPLKEMHVIVPFDRMTSKTSILNSLTHIEALFCLHARNFMAPLYQIFDHHIYKGDYQGEKEGLFLNDGDRGGDRACIIQFSDPNPQRLIECLLSALEKGAQVARMEGYNRGRDEGYRRAMDEMHNPNRKPNPVLDIM